MVATEIQSERRLCDAQLSKIHKIVIHLESTINPLQGQHFGAPGYGLMERYILAKLNVTTAFHSCQLNANETRVLKVIA